MKLGDLACLNKDLTFSKPMPKGLLGMIIEERWTPSTYYGIPGDWSPSHKEFKVLVITSGEYRWFAENSLELMDETR